MKITYSKKFDKKFKNLTKYEQESIIEAMELFKEYPDHPALRNHELRGSMSGKRSISVGEDIRIIFVEKFDYIQVLILDVGTHSEVYFD